MISNIAVNLGNKLFPPDNLRQKTIVIPKHLFLKMATIYVYNDAGVSEECVKQTLYTLQTLLAHRYLFRLIDAKAIKSRRWLSNAALLIMPGGRDVPYEEKLKGEGNDIIRDYVKQGGSYLGICAGAYYAASSIVFDKGGPLQIIAKRDLCLFKGEAIGPAIGPYYYNSDKGAHIIQVQTVFSYNFITYYNGGCYFTNIGNATVLAIYKKLKSPAVIHINYHKGAVILSGVHFEFDEHLLTKKFAIPLKKGHEERIRFLKELFRLLNIAHNGL